RMGGALWRGGGAVDMDSAGGPPGGVRSRDGALVVSLSSLVQRARPGDDAEADPQPVHRCAHLPGTSDERRAFSETRAHLIPIDTRAVGTWTPGDYRSAHTCILDRRAPAAFTRLRGDAI